MSWKLNLLVVDDATDTVRQVLEKILGGRLEGVERTTFLNALSPAPPIGGCLWAERTFLFLGRPLRRLVTGDEPLLEQRIREACAGSAFLVLHLDGTDTSYAWASWDGHGRRVRACAGSCDGVVLEEGAPLIGEQHVLARYRREGGRFVDAHGEVWTHDALGEEFVFALLESAAGFGIDSDVPEELVVTTYRHDARAMRYTLQVEEEATFSNPTSAQVQAALGLLRPTGPSFAVLEATSGSYVQAGGAADEVVVEGRIVRGRRFRHASAGREGRRSPRRRVAMSGGGVTVPSNEVLTVADAVAIFDTFLRAEALDEGFVWRDRTSEFE